MKFSDKTKFTLSSNVLARKIEDTKYMLIEIDGDSIFELHDVAGAVFLGIQEAKNFGEIIESLSDEFEPFGSDEVREVEELLKDLLDRNIIVLSKNS